MTGSLPDAPPSISVVVPVYRGEKTLPLLVQRLEPVLASLASAFELILVNDGSPDLSWQVIKHMTHKHPWVRGISLMRNFGQHNALLCGIRAAQYDIVVTMDDDLQHPPEEIPHLIKEILRGADMVYGRPQREQHGLWRNLASRATKLGMERLIGTTNARDISSFRAFRLYLRDGFARFQSSFVCIDVLLSWCAANASAVEVRREPRKIGSSTYSSWKLFVATVNAITAYSTLPLRLATLLGFVMAIFGIAVLVFVIGHFLLHGSVPGFPFLACIVSIFSGAQLLALGIIGEYLGRIFLRSMDRPNYAIKEVTRPEPGVVSGSH